MPARFKAIKRSFMSEGVSEKEAATRAAKIYNASLRSGEAAMTPGNPHGNPHGKKVVKRKRRTIMTKDMGASSNG